MSDVFNILSNGDVSSMFRGPPGPGRAGSAGEQGLEGQHGDSGGGAILSDLRSRFLEMRPGFIWAPAFAGGNRVIPGKWLHDLEADNRFEPDYGTLSIAWRF